MELILAKAHDAPEILAMQRQAFLPLLEKYHDDAISPACETLERVLGRVTEKNSYYYIMKEGGESVGAVRVYVPEGGHKKRISPIFVVPQHQGKGYAQKAILMCEQIHGDARWQLVTILEEARNCYLYEKMGYRQTGEKKQVSPVQTLVVYQK